MESMQKVENSAGILTLHTDFILSMARIFSFFSIHGQDHETGKETITPLR
jgi:hypothetical protein